MLLRILILKETPVHDEVSNIIIKILPDKILQFLLNILNSCLKINYFLYSWKTAKIKATKKNGSDPLIAVNYRPISILSNLGKILERIINNQINNKFMEYNNYLNKHRYGFRKQHSMVHQILNNRKYH